MNYASQGFDRCSVGFCEPVVFHLKNSSSIPWYDYPDKHFLCLLWFQCKCIACIQHITDIKCKYVSLPEISGNLCQWNHIIWSTETSEQNIVISFQLLIHSLLVHSLTWFFNFTYCYLLMCIWIYECHNICFATFSVSMIKSHMQYRNPNAPNI